MHADDGFLCETNDELNVEVKELGRGELFGREV